MEFEVTKTGYGTYSLREVTAEERDERGHTWVGCSGVVTGAIPCGLGVWSVIVCTNTAPCPCPTTFGIASLVISAIIAYALVGFGWILSVSKYHRNPGTLCQTIFCCAIGWIVLAGTSVGVITFVVAACMCG
jgi:hypothetical protein